MNEILLQLLNKLEAIEERNEDFFDTERREVLGDFIFDGFIYADSDAKKFKVPIWPHHFLIMGERPARTAIQTYINQALPLANKLGLDTFRQRLAAFQNLDVSTASGRSVDDFFGWVDPDDYDTPED